MDKQSLLSGTIIPLMRRRTTTTFQGVKMLDANVLTYARVFPRSFFPNVHILLAASYNRSGFPEDEKTLVF
jgi:hypothetical protein